MNAPDLLCDLRMLRADYVPDTDASGPAGHCFAVTIRASDKLHKIEVPEAVAELFAAELEAVAAIIRSRVIQERIAGEIH